jgi:hypothetical protein
MSLLRKWRYVFLILGLAVVVWLVMDFNGRVTELNRLKSEREYVEKRYQEVLGTKTALQAEVDYANSDAAVEKWAYEEGHLSRTGDNPVIPVSVGAILPTPTPKPAMTVPQISNSEGWLALFLGPKTP